MRVELAVPLAPRTTLGLGGPAHRMVRVDRVGEIGEALKLAGAEPVLVLGGGSNLVVRDGGFPGLVIAMAIPGITRGDTTIYAGRDEDATLDAELDDGPEGEPVQVAVGAGVAWDHFVAQMVEDQLVGVECLSGIPGLVGATPMQNVGAYGQEVSDTIELVRVFDRETQRLEVWPAAACGFGYRTSAFKGSDRWIVVEVVFRLRRGKLGAPLRYPELARALGVPDGGRAPLAVVRDTVIALRRGKGMVVDLGDPDSRSAGSFFTNPIVDAATLATLDARLPAGTTMPKFAAPAGLTKLSAGWLIEHAGFAKGYRPTPDARVGISSKHALALVARGEASTAELLALARAIQDAVRERLGIALVPEPVIVGV